MTTGWIYPYGYESPAPAPDGFRLEVETDLFLGLYVRWRYVREESERVAYPAIDPPALGYQGIGPVASAQVKGGDPV
ncbi:hypothetical protein [Celeribacter halophilus]|uniref:Uncharacterized protein n=1 Tax=Celeribacter halophilus TaxID=576117 RepID=A0A1I3XFT8_9RHOB|nr:hypothetical protein [Celeribacter halophilus]SFK18350.1 hypothetical protein SAMN04488138_1532 [Celeribacter halophilus]